MKTVAQVAKELAQAHVEEDPNTTNVYFVGNIDDEVRLVEVSGSLADVGPGEVIPVRFDSRPDQDIPYASVVVLLSPSEWKSVQEGTLKLPAGWSLDDLKAAI